MKKYFGLAALFVGAWIVFLVLTLPAGHVQAWLQERMPQLRLYEVSGTAWSGHSRTLMYNNARLQNVSWQVRFLPLLQGCMGLHFEIGDTTQQGSGDLTQCGETEAQLENTRLSLPASTIAALSGRDALEPGGQAEFDIGEAAFENQSLAYIDGRLSWNNASIAFPEYLELGNLIFDASTADDGNIALDIRDGGGPLEVRGRLNLAPEGNYDLDTLITPRAEASSSLVNLLPSIGSRTADGAWNLVYRGQL